MKNKKYWYKIEIVDVITGEYRYTRAGIASIAEVACLFTGLDRIRSRVLCDVPKLQRAEYVVRFEYGERHEIFEQNLPW